MKFILKHQIELLLIIFSLLFSSWLMWHTFSYRDGTILIATKAWSDFASHIPLIRSFSFGENFPPEYPLFAGPPIKYHFIFYSLVGFLEKAGLPLDWALNLPSILGFATLLFIIYLFSKTLFHSKAVGILSVIFFLFNGSFSFLEFLSIHPISWGIFHEMATNTTFPSFGPYDNKIVSAFWNLNIYTNQRHLALAYGISLILVLGFIKMMDKGRRAQTKYAVLLGLVLGLFPFFHLAVFLMTAVIIGVMFIVFPKIRLATLITLLVGGVIALPQYLYLQQSPSTFSTQFFAGYLSLQPFSFNNFFQYWFMNLGLHLLLIPFGIYFATPLARKIFLSFFALFIIGNTIQFAPEIAANHKFFNYFIIIGGGFSAYFLYLLWSRVKIFRPMVVTIFILLTLSGLIDFFPVLNDGKVTITDHPKDQNISWIMSNTPKDSVVLNGSYIYDPASVAGRKIFLGWPYFAWSAGYDTDQRYKVISEILSSSDKNASCELLTENQIDYIESDPKTFGDPNYPVESPYFSVNFKPVYQNNQTNFKIYSVAENCNLAI